MIDEHRILKLECIGGGTAELEVNYSNNDKVKDCQMIRFRKDKQEFEVKREDLLSLMLIIGDEKTQKSLLPMQTTKVKKIERLLTFDWVASRDYKKGDKITIKAPWIQEEPVNEEMLSGNVHTNKNPLKFIVK